jgi:subtilisin family serine protease
MIRDSIRSDISRREFHGTTVAGVVGANSSEAGFLGVAPEAKIIPIRAAELFGGFPTVPAVEAIGYAAARGADVINLSWGRMMPTTAVADAIADVLAANPSLIIVAAAGNDGENRVGFPAGLRNVISVGASTLQGTRAPYSSYGPGLNLVAPGGNVRTGLEGGILSTSGTGGDQFWQGIAIPDQPWSPAQDPRGNYVWTQGTSFASPAVAGVVALMLSADPERRLNRDRIIALLEAASSHSPLSLAPNEQELYRVLRDQSATPPDETLLQYFFGSGLVDAGEAVRLVQASLR